jgi:calcineurin-like phosphoesterase family protein
MIWFTSDQHFGHKNIIKFCGRPFIDVEHMNANIIARHNSLVNPNDDVYHLGDLTYQMDASEFLMQMNGNHHLILGNHDHKFFHKRQGLGAYASINDTKIVAWKGKKFFLSHYAHRVWPSSHFGAIHLYGHSHGTLPGFGKSMDVGVDTNLMFPYSADNIMELMSDIDHIGVDHHVAAFKGCVE